MAGLGAGIGPELLAFRGQNFLVGARSMSRNAAPPRRAHQVADVYLASIMKPRENKPKESENKEKSETSLDPEQLKYYSGDYWSEELAVAYRVGMADERLKVLSIADASGSPR